MTWAAVSGTGHHARTALNQMKTTDFVSFAIQHTNITSGAEENREKIANNIIKIFKTQRKMTKKNLSCVFSGLYYFASKRISDADKSLRRSFSET